MQKEFPLCITAVINVLINVYHQSNLHKNLALNTNVINVLADNLRLYSIGGKGQL